MRRIAIVSICLALVLATSPASIYADNLLFPWRADSSNWYWTSGWHSGSHNGGEALDFAPGSKQTILAAQTGVIVQICKGLKSYNVVVKSDSGLVLEYWHMMLEQKPANIRLGSRVILGQKLGTTSGKHSYDGCGVSTGHHLHWVFTTPNKVDYIQGWKLGSGSKLTNSNSVAYPGDDFKSANAMNYGKEIGCWEGRNVYLIDHVFDVPSIYTIVCYASDSIFTAGNTRVEDGHKIEFRAGKRIVLASGFKASAKSSPDTEFSARIGEYTF